MKIVSYNLHFGGNTNPDNHWQRLNSEFQPEFICAQESLHPSKYFSPEELAKFKGCIHSNVHHGRWGSAILSRNHILEEVTLELPEFDGWVVGAIVHDFKVVDTSKTVLILSVHAPSPGPYEPRVSRMLDAIIQKWGQTPLIIAGDFNITTAIRQFGEDLQNTTGEIRILMKLKNEQNVHNAWQFLHPKDALPQTLRWSKNPKLPYHCDGIFLSEFLLPDLTSAEVISDGFCGSLSDHNPIVISLQRGLP